jgi:fluoride exporter
LLKGLGGALGTGARFLLFTWVARTFGADIPRGTVLMNLTGSFLICAIMKLSISAGVFAETTCLFLTTGIMGGHTTTRRSNSAAAVPMISLR